jgi:fructokinase
MTVSEEVPQAPPQGTIVVGGEALFDVVATDGDELRAHPGGGPFNAARTVARLEQPVAYLGRVSNDRFGARLERILVDDGVHLEAVVRTDDPTTLALAELDERGSARYRFYFEGTSAAGLTTQEALAALPERVDILFVGTLGLVLEPLATALEAVVEHVAGRAMIAIDPNCRPSAVRDPAAYRGRLGRVLAHSHLVKVSEEDIAWLDPGRDALEAARALLDDGPSVALLTRGGDGVTVIGRDRHVDVAAPKVRVVDTIGAGDAFAGGFLAWWHAQRLDGEALEDLDMAVEAAAFACLVAAKTCERAGASPPRRLEL